MNKYLRLVLGIGMITPTLSVAISCGNTKTTSKEDEQLEDEDKNEDDQNEEDSTESQAIKVNPRSWVAIGMALSKDDAFADLSEQNIDDMGLVLNLPEEMTGAKVRYNLSEVSRVSGKPVEFLLKLGIIKSSKFWETELAFKSVDRFLSQESSKIEVEEIIRQIGQIGQTKEMLMNVYHTHFAKTEEKHLPFTKEINDELGLNIEIPDYSSDVSLTYRVIPEVMKNNQKAEYFFELNVSVNGVWGQSLSAIIKSSDNYNPVVDERAVDEIVASFGELVPSTDLTFKDLSTIAKYSQSRYRINGQVLSDLKMNNQYDLTLLATKHVSITYKLSLVNESLNNNQPAKFKLAIWFSKNGFEVKKEVEITSKDNYVESVDNDAQSVEQIKTIIGRADRLNQNSSEKLKTLIKTTDTPFNDEAISDLGIGINLPTLEIGIELTYTLWAKTTMTQNKYDQYELNVKIKKGQINESITLDMHSSEIYATPGVEKQAIIDFKNEIGEGISSNEKTIAHLDEFVKTFSLTEDGKSLNTSLTQYQEWVSEEELGVQFNKVSTEMAELRQAKGIRAKIEFQLLSKVVGEKAKYMLTIHLSKSIPHPIYGVTWDMARDKIQVAIESSDVVVEETNKINTLAEVNRVKALFPNGKIDTNLADRDITLPSDVSLDDLLATRSNKAFLWKGHVTGTFGFFTIHPESSVNDEDGELKVLYTAYPKSAEAGEIQVVELTFSGFLSSHEDQADMDSENLSDYYWGSLKWGTRLNFAKSRDLFATTLDSYIGKEIHQYDLGAVNNSQPFPVILSDQVRYKVLSVKGEGKLGKAYEIEAIVTNKSKISKTSFILLSRDYVWEN